ACNLPEIPETKLQIPRKHQIPRFKTISEGAIQVLWGAHAPSRANFGASPKFFLLNKKRSLATRPRQHASACAPQKKEASAWILGVDVYSRCPRATNEKAPWALNTSRPTRLRRAPTRQARRPVQFSTAKFLRTSSAWSRKAAL